MKEIINIAQTSDSPFINFNPNKGSLIISGQSLLNDPYTFYQPLIEAVKNHVSNEENLLKVEVMFEYMNSGTCRYFMELLFILQNSQADHKISWFYKEGDAVIEEKGQQFKSLVHVNFLISESELKRA